MAEASRRLQQGPGSDQLRANDRLHHARIVALCAQRLAREGAKDQLRAQGIKVWHVSAKELTLLAKEFLAKRPDIIERAKKEAARYVEEEEQSARNVAVVQNLEVLHKPASPARDFYCANVSLKSKLGEGR